MATTAPQDIAAKVTRPAATPLAGAIAGILFALCFGVSIIILHLAMGEVEGDTGAWLESDLSAVRLALGLLPFAGLFFLWFIAVVRERLGRFEDQFFSTVFIASGTLFLAMVFAAAAGIGAIAAVASRDPEFAGSATYTYARTTAAQIFGVYALRMAAVFLLSQATLWLRTRVMPRWMALLTYPLALVLLFIVDAAWWVILVFPAWVLLVSVYILIASLRQRRAADADSVTAPEAASDQVTP